jgi:6,7-dimethyl-8-ribityllumazine synthase
MLEKNKSQQSNASGAVFAIVASTYNARFVDSMLRAARRELRASGAASIRVVRVPGAFEIPVVTAALAHSTSHKFSGIICLGVILRGATTHAQHIGESVTNALMQIQLTTGVPVIHEVLLLENQQQAVERCMDSTTNRGTEAAQTAVAMARVMSTVQVDAQSRRLR